MTETKHTPGPWTPTFSAEGSYVVYSDEFGPTQFVADAGERTDERDANAYLIAAAPDMLEALADAAFSFGSLGVLFEPGHPAREAMQEAKQRVNATIAKAEGR